MPHFIVEYTDNLKADVEIRDMLKKANEILIAQDGVFPIGGIRSRAIELNDYVMADDEEDYAFLHATLKIGRGRSKAEKETVCDALFEMIKKHVAQQFENRYMALSMECLEFGESGTYKHNNVHACFKKDAS